MKSFALIGNLLLVVTLSSYAQTLDGGGSSNTNSTEMQIRTRVAAGSSSSTGSNGSGLASSGTGSNSLSSATVQRTTATSHGSGVIQRPSPQISATPEGSAVAAYAPHVARFSTDASQSEALKLTIPSRKGPLELKSHIVGLGLWNYETGDAVLFAWHNRAQARLSAPRSCGTQIFWKERTPHSATPIRQTPSTKPWFSTRTFHHMPSLASKAILRRFASSSPLNLLIPLLPFARPGRSICATSTSSLE